MKPLDWYIVAAVLAAIVWGSGMLYDAFTPVSRTRVVSAVQECARKVAVRTAFPVVALQEDGTLGALTIVREQKVFLCAAA